jgi:hypothetical protein
MNDSSIHGERIRILDIDAPEIVLSELHIVDSDRR